MSKFSENLKDLLSEAELNASSLARRTEIDASTLAALLRGESLPSMETLIKLADHFLCSTDYLLGLSDDLKEISPRRVPPFPERLTFLLQYFKVTKYRLEHDTGFSEKTVNRWHNGKTCPAADSLIRLAKYFDCSVDFLLGRSDLQ